MKFSINFWTRKLHRWFSIAICLPLILVICTGLLLQLKKHWGWVQPPTRSGIGEEIALSFDDILEISKRYPQAEIADWSDVDRLDVRPNKGVVKVRCNNRWELQIDLASGDLLSSAYRRSDLIESLHDGSWFSDLAKLLIFLPNGIVLLFLWFTGLYLWYLPFGAKRKKRQRSSTGVNQSSATPNRGDRYRGDR